MAISKYEQETIITFNESEPNANVYTCNKKLINRLDKLASESSVIIEVNRDDISKTYNLPKKLVAIKKPRYLSMEQREKLRNRAIENFGE